MPDKRKQVGTRGEDTAAQYLLKRDYTVLERNWRCASGELDIIARDDQTLVFVEVRTRSGDRFGSPEASITPSKQARLVTLAQTYLQETNAQEQSWRIDVIAIYLEAGSTRINHIKNAVGWNW